MGRNNGDDKLYKAGLKNYDVTTIKSLFHWKTVTYAATSIALMIFASAARGEIFLFTVMLWKNWNEFQFLPTPSLFSASEPMREDDNSSIKVAPDADPSTPSNDTSMNALDEFLKQYHMQYCYIHVLAGLASSYFLFFLVGGFLQW